MRQHQMQRFVGVLLMFLLVLGLSTASFAQGRGRGGGAGGGRGSGGGMGGVGLGNPNGGRPDGVGVDRGLGRSSSASNGRADVGRGRAADKSNGRSEEGLNRARLASDNLRRADKELREHPGITSTLHVNANDLRNQYHAALANNPNLKFGQFVSATRVAQNLGRRHPNITRSAILAGLASGRSLGQTLQDLGLSDHEANETRKQAEREIKRARER
ncbi:MAG TPA: hypothetical protein VE135_14655 [Pyrinomonadaceae bacterium]|nr:hypothetical protein [Pyrinomonadaceae bacterium]